MSMEYPCVYFEKDGKCRKFSDDTVISYCVMGPCPEQKLSNADRIRDMSDEELANTMYSNPIFIVCDAVCKGDCAAIDTLNDTKEDACKRTILEWLQQPAEEDT